MATGAIGLKTHIWNNNLRSLALLGVYPLILLGIVWGVGAVLGQQQDPVAAGNGFVAAFWPALVTIVAIWFTVAWFFHAAMIRTVARSRPLERREEPELYNMLENMCISRGAPMPRLEIIETHARNAFASGINDRTYAITVTRGLLQALQPDEVEAVLGHELTHILNRDVRLLMVCVIFTGMIGFVAQMLWSNLRFGPVLTRGRSGRGQSLLPYFLILGVVVVGYLASLLARFALSRSREFMADAGAVELTRHPEAMMRALLRISGRDRIPQATGDIALMCIENSVPFMGLFATHPPIEQRLRAIAHTTGAVIPVLGAHAPAATSARFQRPGDRQPDWPNRTRPRNPWL